VDQAAIAIEKVVELMATKDANRSFPGFLRHGE
jgi:hypothetical protein